MRSRPEYPRQRSRRSLAYYDGLRRERGPANLLQGLRHYFGAHTYRRLDKPGVFHTRWAEERQRRDERAILPARDARVRMSRPRGQAGFQFAACVLR